LANKCKVLSPNPIPPKEREGKKREGEDPRPGRLALRELEQERVSLQGGSDRCIPEIPFLLGWAP
jgi:hypothetical protein